MLTLRECQEKLVQGLNNQNDSILKFIANNPAISAQEHLAIYQSSIKGALQKVLKEIYPVCHKLVGEDFFINMINGYIDEHPSRSADLASYGANLATYIATFKPAKTLVYLSDVAKLEWAWHQLYSARASNGIDYQQLAEQFSSAGEKIIFQIPPGATLLASPYPIHQIWAMNQDDYEGPETIQLPENENFYYLIWRKELSMRIDLLQFTEWQILSWMAAEETIEKISNKIEDLSTKIDFEIVLPELVSRGWAAEFKIAEDECNEV